MPRHRTPKRRTLFSAGNLSLRLDERRVAVGGKPVTLTYQEFELLALLLHERPRVVRHRQIEQRLWHRTGIGLRKRTRVIVHRLRVKLAQLEPHRIEAVARIGYRLSIPENQ